MISAVNAEIKNKVKLIYAQGNAAFSALRIMFIIS